MGEILILQITMSCDSWLLLNNTLRSLNEPKMRNIIERNGLLLWANQRQTFSINYKRRKRVKNVIFWKPNKFFKVFLILQKKEEKKEEKEKKIFVAKYAKTVAF
jgi:hypothetical protein